MITLDTNYGILTQLPSTSSILKIDDNLLTTDLMSATAPETSYNGGNNGNRDVNDGLFLHEALAKLEDNCVLLDMKSAASRAVLLTVFERSIKWCHIFLMTSDLNSLEIVQKIDHDLKEMITKFEKLLGSLFFLELEMEPFMVVVVSSSIASTYHCILEKFSGFFKQQMKQHLQENSNIITATSFDIQGITEQHIQLFKWIFLETYESCLNLIDVFLNNDHGNVYKNSKPDQSIIWDPPSNSLFNKSVKSLFHTTACFRRFKNLLQFDPRESQAIETKLNDQMEKVCDLVFHKDDDGSVCTYKNDRFGMKNMGNALPDAANDWKKEQVVRLQLSLKTWLDKLDHKPEEISYFNIL
ncbi:unnamed protein product [Ambrosiozyma monospora]|uniref:Unnamed protein product n=1 Tax=Ambrosiozyma monospora TaxID=43982 RepID=A0A9W7DI50_AMBMO|nr:unnamed protein product [Ambrosiozyma monospora]